MLVLLTGDLGTGKTTLTKGIVSGLGAANEDDVTSPTFTLVHVYGKPPKVYHVDCTASRASTTLRPWAWKICLQFPPWSSSNGPNASPYSLPGPSSGCG